MSNPTESFEDQMEAISNEPVDIDTADMRKVFGSISWHNFKAKVAAAHQATTDQRVAEAVAKAESEVAEWFDNGVPFGFTMKTWLTVYRTKGGQIDDPTASFTKKEDQA